MKTGILIVIVLIIIVIGVGLYLFSNMNNPASTNNNGGNTNSGAGNTGSSGGEGDSGSGSGTVSNTPKTYNVEIKEFAFNPSTITINKGDTVVWINKDSIRHSVVSDSGSELDSSLLSQEQSYSHTFNEAGTYNYHCAPHSYMKAKIIVE